MDDAEHGLERVGRERRPGLWIGAWAAALAAVVALAVGGRAGSTDGLVAVPEASPAPVSTAAHVSSPAAVAVASPNVAGALPRIIRPPVARVPSSPRPYPTLGDDGLVGGTAYSSPVPVDWFERSARANGQ